MGSFEEQWNRTLWLNHVTRQLGLRRSLSPNTPEAFYFNERELGGDAVKAALRREYMARVRANYQAEVVEDEG